MCAQHWSYECEAHQPRTPTFGGLSAHTQLPFYTRVTITCESLHPSEGHARRVDQLERGEG